MGICMYLRFKFARWLFVCVRVCSELETEVCAGKVVFIVICALSVSSRINVANTTFGVTVTFTYIQTILATTINNSI